MKIKILFAGLLALALFTAGYAQTPDKAKLEQFFDRLAEKNKAMGSLTMDKTGKVVAFDFSNPLLRNIKFTRLSDR